MDAALAKLRGRSRAKRTMWSRRAQEYQAKIASGDPACIAEVVRDLFRNAGQPEQSYSERQIYQPRSTGWSASSRRSSGSTKQQRSAESSSCCRPPDRPLRGASGKWPRGGGVNGGPEGKLARLRGARRIWAVGSVHARLSASPSA